MRQCGQKRRILIVNDLGRALEKRKKSKELVAFACKFVLFGKQNIATVIDPTATAIPR
jgi:hypothetical protein